MEMLLLNSFTKTLNDEMHFRLKKEYELSSKVCYYTNK